MSEQQQAFSPQKNKKVPWVIRLCRWLWKHPLPFLGSTVLVNVIINILSTWLITDEKNKAIPETSLLGRLAVWGLTHQFSALLLFAFSALLLFVTRLGSRWESTSQAPPLTPQDRTHMLRRLQVRYKELVTQTLQDALRIELGLTSRPAAIQNTLSLSLRLPEQPERPLPAHTSILEVYQQAQQELLILGEPGAGKSTLLLELAQHLVTQAEQDEAHPLPVLIPLSSWAAKRLPLQDWLIEQFASLYDVPRALSQRWVQGDLFLPLLDGLDEMDEAARAACIAAINVYHREHLRPLVVCSRTSEYTAATTQQERLALHTAVVVQPLSIHQVDTHLERLGESLAALRRALKKNVTLQELATTPLMLQVLMLTYQGTSVRELSHKEGQVRQQIWADYVQRMMKRKKAFVRYTSQDFVSWLQWLARQMRAHNQTIFLLERLQPDWLLKGQRTLYQWSIGLVFGLVVALVFGLGLGLPTALGRGLVFGLGLGLLLGLLFWPVAAPVVGLVFGKKIEPAETLTWSWKDARPQLLRWLAGGLVFGLVFALVFALVDGLFSRLLSVLVFGLSIGLFLGLFLGLGAALPAGLRSKRVAERQALSPNEGIRRSIKNGLFLGLIVGLLSGLIVGLGAGLYFGLLLGLGAGLGNGLFSGLGFGLFSGLVGGLGGGLAAAVQHYTLRFWLARTHTFPWKAVPFLEDARARMLLRRVGGGYSFTHRLLLDHFADLQTAPSAPSTPAHPAQQPPPP